MKSRVRAAIAGVGFVCLAAMGGCQNNKGEATEISTLTERNNVLQAQLEQQRTEAQIAQQRNRQTDQALAEQRQLNETLSRSLDNARQQLALLGQQIGEIQMIDPTTSAALQRLASANPGLMEYDATTGRLRFASDLTFDSGKDEVKSEARSALQQLASVLNSASAGNYEVQVVGHTDAQPISSGTAKFHPTNLHLSAHRAISVVRVLNSAGVPQDRLMAAGWGDQRPIASSGPKGESAANRRVEIYLTASRTGGNSGMAGNSTNRSGQTPAQREANVPTEREELMK